MERKEKKLTEGWKFWFGNTKEGEGQPVEIPHDWVIGEPFTKDRREASQGFRVRRGTGWYENLLQVDVEEGHRYFLDFDGIYERSSVWINGSYAGGHKYGYTPFRLEITDLVKLGENRVEIRVDSDVVPTDRWYTGAGLYRTVKLLETGKRYLDEREIIVSVNFPGNGYEEAAVIVETGNDFPVKGEIQYAGEHVTAEGRQGRLEFRLQKPFLWSAENPRLYQLKVCSEDDGSISDTAVLSIGLRDVRIIPDKGLYVNGNPVKLRGVCLHQDAGCLGVAAKKEIWKKCLEKLKEMGCNAIRAAHHMHSAEFMDLCDELGFYVYEECFDKWTGGHYGSFFETEWRADLGAMVKRDRNRPCVIIWGVGNEVENQGQNSMLRILKMLVAELKELDGTRPVTYAMNPHFKRESQIDISRIKNIQEFVDEVDDTEILDVEEKIDRIKEIGKLVDILSCNYQEQWYEQIHTAMPEKLILGTEVYQYFKGHPDQFKNYTQDNPSLVPERYDYVIGSMIWAGIDYLGESMGYPAKGWNGALIRTNGEPKAGYYIMQSYWTARPMVHFEVMDYSLSDEGVKDHWDIPMYAGHWHFPQFTNTVVPYMIASNCDKVELYINDSRIYIPEPQESPNHLITGFLPWIPGRVTVIGLMEGKEACRQEIVTPGPAVKLGFDQDYAKIPAERGYQLLLSVRALDEAGNPYFRESAKIQFRVEGPAEILAVDNGDPKSGEAYQENFRHLYHGCASVVIRAKGKAGRIVLWADADGMSSGRAVICAE